MAGTPESRTARAPGAPAPMTSNPARLIIQDYRTERRARRPYPPGLENFSPRRANQFIDDPLGMLLELYERFGPIFSLRTFHVRQVFMLGPEANHFALVSGRDNLAWREGNMRELEPLLGAGLLTIDGPYHDRARRIMMPAFHRQQIEASVETMVDEVGAALARWQPDLVVDVYSWARRLAMRIALRALLGLDPDDGGAGAQAAHHFERALEIYSTGLPARLLRGPGTAFGRMVSSRKVLDRIVYAEIEQRRARPDSERLDLMSLLLHARDEDGSALSDVEVRDQMMTLLFAGHDTTTSTISFMLYELARHPAIVARIRAEADEVLGQEPPTAAALHGGLPYLDTVLDETLRLYPPAWIGPRRAVRDFEFGGYEVPEGAFVNYSSWASHRLPHVFPDPEAFLPERFSPERKAALPRGAYVPFGGGPRICIGKRFGQTEVRVMATMILQRFGTELLPGRHLKIRQMPTLGPSEPMSFRVTSRS